MISDNSLFAAGAFLAGLLLAWLLRAAHVSRLRREVQHQQHRQHELELEYASLHSAQELLLQQRDEYIADVRSLRGECERWRAGQIRSDAQREALEQSLSEQRRALRETRDAARLEFENLANRIFEARGQQFSERQSALLSASIKPLGDLIERFQTRVNEVHRETVAGQAGLGEQLRTLQQASLQMGEQADSLARALKGEKKTAGNWGELQLERALQLAGLEPGIHYEGQVSMRSGDGQRQVPDFIVNLPDDKHLVLDSKVSLVDYERAVAAGDDEEQRSAALQAHVKATRRHIDELSSKDYAALPGLDSPSLVFLFMPIEAAFMEALRFDGELIEYGQRRNIVLTSPNTLLPMLRTVANLWIAYQSDREARALSDAAGEIFNKTALLSQRLDELGKTLSTAIGKYNHTVTAIVGRQGLHSRIERFRKVAANARGELPQPMTLEARAEHDRLVSAAQGSDNEQALSEASFPSDQEGSDAS